VRITRPEISVLTIDELLRAKQWRVIFGRTLRNGEMILADGSTRLQHGDLVSLIGTEEEVTEAAAFLGEMTTERLELDRSKLDFRRIFVSNPRVVGAPPARPAIATTLRCTRHARATRRHGTAAPRRYRAGTR
jgi:putative transport protein